MSTNLTNHTLSGNIVDVKNRTITAGTIHIAAGKIATIELREGVNDSGPYILPGFIDSHVHIESSMLIPSEFARLAVVHGTVATISDPHEIANVCGMEGVEFMIENGNAVPFKFNFGAPSCVPATPFETAGAALSTAEVEALLSRKEIKYLSEMMNFPGVLHKDLEVMAKITTAHFLDKPVDGHAPGLTGALAEQYINAGISTDHECFTAAEALEKLKYGMKIIIREGSAAKNFDALADLLHDHWPMMMFCSDDKHPDSLVEGHINQLCARAVARRVDVFKVLTAACINPVEHYRLDVGLLKPGNAADCIVVEDLVHFKVLQTYIEGQLVAEHGVTHINPVQSGVINNFSCVPKRIDDLAVAPLLNNKATLSVIEALDGQLITNKLTYPVGALMQHNGRLYSNTAEDLLKIAVINRYEEQPVALGWIKNFGLKEGAIASTVAHDSHNLIVVGTTDEAIVQAVNLLIETKGGISCVGPQEQHVLSLPVAGLMSTDDGYAVAAQYTKIDAAAKALGSTLSAPFMTLSFMALLVIPHLKLSDKGLFDGDIFKFVEASRIEQ